MATVLSLTAVSLSLSLVAVNLVADPPASAATTKPPSPSGYQAEAGETFLVDEEPSNWNPHSAVQPADATGPTAADVAAPTGESRVDTAGPDDEVLDQILAPVLPSVFDVGPGLHVQLNRAFVQSAIQTSDRPQTVVYQINPRAAWSDGQAVTYRDFQYNWRAQSGDSGFHDAGGTAFAPRTTAGYRQIASVRESGGDPYRVKVVFRTPDPDWRALFAYMLPAHIATKVGFDAGFTDPVDDLSAGPFEVQSYTPGLSVTLVRNQRYWAAPANLAQITYRFVPGTASTVDTLAAGDAQAAAPAPAVGLAAELAKAVSSHPSRSLDLSGFSVDEVAGPDWEHLDFNQANPILADDAVRRAIMMAVDRSKLIATTVGKDDPKVKPLGSLVFLPGQAGYHNDAGVYGTGNTLGARTALEQDGYRYAGGRLMRHGTPVRLRITAPSGDPLLRAEEQVLARQLGSIGIHLTIRNSADLPATLASGGYDLALVSSEASPFPSSVESRYGTVKDNGMGVENFLDYSSPATDRLINQAERATRPARRRQLFEQLDGQLWADAVSLPLYQIPQFLVYDHQYLNMVDVSAPAGLAWGIAKWGVPASV